MIDYTLDTEEKWIYCNYPEHLTPAHMASANHCLNQVTVPAGSGMLFYSYNAYDSTLPKTIWLGIQIYNPEEKPIEIFTQFGCGDSTAPGLSPEEYTNWDKVAYESWDRFYRKPPAIRYHPCIRAGSMALYNSC